jgi:hypothetical protein
MKYAMNAGLALVAILTLEGASGEPVKGSQTFLIESPSELPAVAQVGGADVYFRGGVDANSYLYIESASGKSVSILDVTEPSRITSVGSVDLPSAKGPYAFVRALNSRDVLIRYKDHSGYAVLDLSKYDHPVLAVTNALAEAQSVEVRSDELLASSDSPPTDQSGPTSAFYTVLDTSQGTPATLLNLANVRGKTVNPDTNTLFVITDQGLTVIRDLAKERVYAEELTRSTGAD